MEFKKLSEMKKNYYHCKAGKNNIVIDFHELESDPFISKVLDDIKSEIMTTIGRDTVENLAFFLKAELEDKEIYIDLELVTLAFSSIYNHIELLIHTASKLLLSSSISILSKSSA